jgi:hypothetical protein
MNKGQVTKNTKESRRTRKKRKIMEKSGKVFYLNGFLSEFRDSFVIFVREKGFAL